MRCSGYDFQSTSAVWYLNGLDRPRFLSMTEMANRYCYSRTEFSPYVGIVFDTQRMGNGYRLTLWSRSCSNVREDLYGGVDSAQSVKYAEN